MSSFISFYEGVIGFPWPVFVVCCVAQVDAYSELLVTHPLISLSEPLHPLHRGYVTKLGEDVKQFIQGAKGDMVDLFKQHFDGIGGDRDCIIQVRCQSTSITLD